MKRLILIMCLLGVLGTAKGQLYVDAYDISNDTTVLYLEAYLSEGLRLNSGVGMVDYGRRLPGNFKFVPIKTYEGNDTLFRTNAELWNFIGKNNFELITVYMPTAQGYGSAPVAIFKRKNTKP